MKANKFVKKPIVIEAIQLTDENRLDIIQWAHDGLPQEANVRISTPPISRGLTIHTLEGPLHASVGDYIIKGVKGEFYPCKPDVFEASYDHPSSMKEKCDGSHHVTAPIESCECGQMRRPTVDLSEMSEVLKWASENVVWCQPPRFGVNEHWAVRVYFGSPITAPTLYEALKKAWENREGK